jgi:hypothetical protein
LATGHAPLDPMRIFDVKLAEHTSLGPATSTMVFVGRNHVGLWVVQEQNGRYGGLFVNRAQAVKYALTANGHHAETIVELSREIELSMGGRIAFGRGD